MYKQHNGKTNFKYSLKNIPTPSKTNYHLKLIDKIESVIKRMRWKASFFLSEPKENLEKPETFGFKTKLTPSSLPELASFENELIDLCMSIKFNKQPNHFQSQLHKDKNTIKNSTKVLVFADKTNNIYSMTKTDHNKLLKDNVTKTYKKAPENLEKSINFEAEHIANSYNLSERVECIATNPAFVTLKDHKDNFLSKPTCRLINPAKSELGKISKSILDKINKSIKNKLMCNQWKNSKDVINWFQNLNHKNSSFIQFDIKEFNPSISPNVLSQAVRFASTFANITDIDLRTINHCRKSLLFFNNESWKKKNTDSCSDVTMGSFDGAEICELVGLFILNELSKFINKGDIGLYRDDGLMVTTLSSGRLIEKLRQKIIKTFKDIGFDIEITTNL